VVLAADVTLAPLRAALLADAQARAASLRAEAEERVRAELESARARADALVARARVEAQQRAELAALRGSSAQRRAAQRRILEARREAYEALRAEALGAVLGLRDEPGYEQLLDRLEREARARLGDEVVIERDPDGAGGVIARDGQRLIEATLPALAARALDELGPEVGALWE
jgi:vacuolar-type H+-ATPase subunit E/Vma4